MQNNLMTPERERISDAEIVEAARRQASKGVTVIAFADSRYIDVLMNWLVALAVNGVENYLVVALDAALYGYLAERRIPESELAW